MGDFKTMIYTYWRKGRKTNHMVWSGDKHKTLCSLKVLQDNRTSVRIDHTNMCKKCLKAHDMVIKRHA